MTPSLLSALPTVSFNAGDTLIIEGQPLRKLYFLVDGALEIKRGGVLINYVEEPGAVLGEMSWLLDRTPTATVVATTPCTVRVAEDPTAFCASHPDVALEIGRVLARRLDSMAKYLVAIKEQFKDRADHLGLLDQMLDSMMNRHPREIPRREAGH